MDVKDDIDDELKESSHWLSGLDGATRVYYLEWTSQKKTVTDRRIGPIDRLHLIVGCTSGLFASRNFASKVDSTRCITIQWTAPTAETKQPPEHESPLLAGSDDAAFLSELKSPAASELYGKQRDSLDIIFDGESWDSFIALLLRFRWCSVRIESSMFAEAKKLDDTAQHEYRSAQSKRRASRHHAAD